MQPAKQRLHEKDNSLIRYVSVCAHITKQGREIYDNPGNENLPRDYLWSMVTAFIAPVTQPKRRGREMLNCIHLVYCFTEGNLPF